MKTILFIILLIIVKTSIAQNKIIDERNTIDLSYGNYSSFKKFYQLSNIKNEPLQMITLGYSGLIKHKKDKSFYGKLAYSFILPNVILVGDTAKAQINGHYFNFSYGDRLVSRSESLSLVFYLGFNIGQLRTYGFGTSNLQWQNYASQKNSFFSPKIGIQPKLRITRKLILNIVFESVLDISKPVWKKLRSNNFPIIQLDNFRQSGVISQIGLGFTL